MRVPASLPAREEKAPLWAAAVPLLYLAACAVAVSRVTRDPGADVGIAGLLLALGLVPAFVVPAIFTTRRVVLSVTAVGLCIDGRLVKIDDARLAQAERGTGRLRLDTPAGKRLFVIDSYREAELLVAQLPPAAAPRLSLRASFSDA